MGPVQPRETCRGGQTMPADRLTTTPRRAPLAWPVLTLLAVLVPVPPAAAGPPEAMSGQMVFDQVADGLRKYRRETASGRRIRWLRKLAPTRDARVASALGDAWGDADGGLGSAAQRLLAEHYCPP